jgi:hypothetical protein
MIVEIRRQDVCEVRRHLPIKSIGRGGDSDW